jgi:hypothetical protein
MGSAVVARNRATDKADAARLEEPKDAPKAGAFAAATADPHISPKDFLLGVTRDPGAPIELRLQAARIAAPLRHGKPGADHPGDSARPVQAESHGASNSAPTPNTANKLSDAIRAFERKLAEREAEAERVRNKRARIGP